MGAKVNAAMLDLSRTAAQGTDGAPWLFVLNDLHQLSSRCSSSARVPNLATRQTRDNGLVTNRACTAARDVLWQRQPSCVILRGTDLHYHLTRVRLSIAVCAVIPRVFKDEADGTSRLLHPSDLPRAGYEDSNVDQSRDAGGLKTFGRNWQCDGVRGLCNSKDVMEMQH